MVVAIAMLAVFGLLVIGSLQLAALLGAADGVPAWARVVIRPELAARGASRVLGIVYSAAFAAVPQAVAAWSLATRASDHGETAGLIWAELFGALAWSTWLLVRTRRVMRR